MRIPYNLVSYADAVAKLDKTAKVFADTETDGFYGNIELLQLYQPGLDSVQMVQNPGANAVLMLLLEYDVVWQNAHYDITTVQQQLGGLAIVPPKITDTLLLGRLAFPQMTSHTLDSIMTKVLGFNPYASFDKKVMQKSNWAGDLTEEQLQYAATDVWYLPAVYDQVCVAENTDSYKLDMLTLNYCLDFQWNGMPVDRERLTDLRKRTDKIVKDIALPINCNSWQQVRPYIDSEQSDDIALAKLALAGSERADAVRKTRKAKKLLSFLNKFETDVIYGKFKPAAKSGRMTSDDQNLQQLPRASKCVFGVDETEVILFADYAQLELRTICAIVNCVKMAELFREGGDLHSITADFIFGDEAALMLKNSGFSAKEIAKLRKTYRSVAKTANFNLLYGGGVGMFIAILIKTANILLSDLEASTTKRKWLNLWLEINQWQQKRIASFNRGQLGCTPLGRQYKAERMTDHLNIENQGAGAEVAKLAIHYLYKYGLKERFPEFKLRNFVHDSYLITGPNDPEKYKPCAIFLAKCMQRAWFEMSKLFIIKDLPMPVNVAVGHNWGDIESDDVENIWEFNLEPHDQYGVSADDAI